MITKKAAGKIKEFKGVTFELLASGEKSMLTKMNYKSGNKVPFHSHPNEQCGYIISGKIRIQFGEYDEILKAGDTYVIPKNQSHSVDVIEPGEVIDFFTPPRKDYK